MPLDKYREDIQERWTVLQGHSERLKKHLGSEKPEDTEIQRLTLQQEQFICEEIIEGLHFVNVSFEFLLKERDENKYEYRFIQLRSDLRAVQACIRLVRKCIFVPNNTSKRTLWDIEDMLGLIRFDLSHYWEPKEGEESDR